MLGLSSIASRLCARVPAVETEWAIAGALAVPIAARAYLGTFARYALDDYCWPVRVTRDGFFGFQADYYMQWSGRWASTGAFGLAGYGSPEVARILPAVAITIWLAAVVWCAYEITGRLALSVVLAESIIVTVLSVAPNSLDPIYWQTGMLAYVPPFILAPLGTASALRFRSPFIAGVSAFAVGGFNESSLALELAALALAFAFTHGHRSLIRAALAGAALSAIIAVVSPGNWTRHAESGDASLLWMAGLSVASTVALPIRVLLAPALIPALLFAAMLTRRLGPIHWPRPGQTGVTALALTLAAVIPAAYGGREVLGRTAFVPTMPLALAVLGIGAYLGTRWSPSGRRLLAATLLLATVATWQALRPLPQLRSYASASDARDVQLHDARAMGIRNATVAPISSPFEAADIHPEPGWGLNQCVASYYGLESVAVAK